MLRYKFKISPAFNLLLGLFIGFFIAVVFDIGRYGRSLTWSTSIQPSQLIPSEDDSKLHSSTIRHAQSHQHHDPHNEEELERVEGGAPVAPMHFHANESLAHHGTTTTIYYAN
jgi:hypothetical protein